VQWTGGTGEVAAWDRMEWRADTAGHVLEMNARWQSSTL